MPYRVSKYDPSDEPRHDDQNWVVMAEARNVMQLRPVIRDLLSMGYDWDVSILVERIDEYTQPQIQATRITSMAQFNAMKQGQLF